MSFSNTAATVPIPHMEERSRSDDDMLREAETLRAVQKAISISQLTPPQPASISDAEKARSGMPAPQPHQEQPSGGALEGAIDAAKRIVTVSPQRQSENWFAEEAGGWVGVSVTFGVVFLLACICLGATRTGLVTSPPEKEDDPRQLNVPKLMLISVLSGMVVVGAVCAASYVRSQRRRS